jgi:hypothetical protein
MVDVSDNGDVAKQHAFDPWSASTVRTAGKKGNWKGFYCAVQQDAIERNILTE